jgi:HSP20 family protein
MFTISPYQRNPWSILDELETLQEDMNRAFTGRRSPARARRAYPPVNVWSSKDGITVDVEVPGVDVKDVDISIEADQLVIRGQVNGHEPKEDETCHRRERATGEFVRALQLPFRADAERVKADYRNGILRIAVPRSEQDKPHKVTIDVA